MRGAGPDTAAALLEDSKSFNAATASDRARRYATAEEDEAALAALDEFLYAVAVGPLRRSLPASVLKKTFFLDADRLLSLVATDAKAARRLLVKIPTRRAILALAWARRKALEQSDEAISSALDEVALPDWPGAYLAAEDA